ncbi:unnamed protein product [Prorocentrum cordatum]|uniref:Uncharacterized protein n=1 Tax=Prorocentrum cordatum TaxID=2364126 RepID=A0ABN9TRY8_9DINO|nr:unnamed protein product [Polarella glacialis]
MPLFTRIMSKCGAHIVDAAKVVDAGAGPEIAPGGFPMPVDRTPYRSVPIDGDTHIPEELFKELLQAGKEARRRGQHEVDDERLPPRQQHLVVASAAPAPGSRGPRAEWRRASAP